MEKLFERISDYLFGILRPVQLVIAVAGVSAALLFSPFGWVGAVGIDPQIDQYRFLVWIAFLFSGALILVWAAQEIWNILKAAGKKVFSELRLRDLRLGVGEKTVLLLLESHRPESVRLHSKHPDVLQLRKHGLIKWGPVVLAGDYQYFYLSPSGESLVNKLEPSLEKELNEVDVVDFVCEVTGMDWKPNAFKRL